MLSKIDVISFVGSILEPNQMYSRVEGDKSGYVFEIFDKPQSSDLSKVKRSRVMNVLVEYHLQKNDALRYLRHYTRTMYEIQRLRIAAGNRKGGLKRLGLSETEVLWMQENVDGSLESIENRLEKRCLSFLEAMPIWNEHLSQIRGIGPRYASSLISFIVTPERFPNFGHLCAFAGLALRDDGNIQKRKKGEQANWSSELKVTLYKISDQFVKTKNSGYRKLYDQFKAREVVRNEARPKKEQLTKGHVDARAKRLVQKIFLSHLYETWCKLEGIPVREPYAIEHLGHTTKIEPITDR